MFGDLFMRNEIKNKYKHIQNIYAICKQINETSGFGEKICIFKLTKMFGMHRYMWIYHLMDALLLVYILNLSFDCERKMWFPRKKNFRQPW